MCGAIDLRELAPPSVGKGAGHRQSIVVVDVDVHYFCENS